MTEEEAKGKWCPFARGSIVMEVADEEGKAKVAYAMGSTGYNRGLIIDADRKPVGQTMPVSCFCIGSACMAWQSTTSDMIAGGIPPEQTGYCGLAGESQ